MFTGIVECVGTVRRSERHAEVLRVWVDAPEIAADLREGVSIAVNGCCVTVEAAERTGFACALTPETLERTCFESRLVAGAKVNLERALRADARLEGHIVQGHVDGVGTVVSLGRSDGGSADLVVEVPGDLERYIVKKGSVAVDGISLTVAALGPGRFGVAVIPYTLERTNLAVTRPGDLVSLETDILARYVERLTGR